MKNSIARNVIISLHKMHIPNINVEIRNSLLQTNPEIVNEQNTTALTPQVQQINAINNDRIKINANVARTEPTSADQASIEEQIRRKIEEQLNKDKNI
jgi:hypothetical protein